MANEFKAKNGLLAPYAGVVYIDLDTTTATTSAKARLWYNTEDDTVNIGHDNGVVQQVGQEFFMPPCKNSSGVTIPNGAFVMATGAQGDKITIAKAVTNGTVAPEYMIGVATRAITTDDEFAQIITNGIVRDLDTSAWAVGTILYPDPANAGGFTGTKPTAPNIKTPIAIVLRQHASTGRIYVRMTNGSVLGGTDSNVEFGTLSDNDLIVYNAANARWENVQPLDVPGLSGYSGFSGYSGEVGPQGDSGFSGYSGQNGIQGDSGFSGYSGYSGAQGTSGWSGYSGASSLNFTYGDTPSISPVAGDIWVDSITGIQYIYVNDGDSSQWVELGLSVAEGITPGGTTGQILAKASNANYDTEWVTPDSFSGYSGYSGQNGSIGVDGASGYSGFSGISGYSGASGISGYSGFSGATSSVIYDAGTPTTDFSVGFSVNCGGVL